MDNLNNKAYTVEINQLTKYFGSMVCKPSNYEKFLKILFIMLRKLNELEIPLNIKWSALEVLFNFIIINNNFIQMDNCKKLKDITINKLKAIINDINTDSNIMQIKQKALGYYLILTNELLIK